MYEYVGLTWKYSVSSTPPTTISIRVLLVMNFKVQNSYVWLRFELIAINFRHLNEWDCTWWYFRYVHSWARLLLWNVLYCSTFRVYIMRYAENSNCFETCDIIFIFSSWLNVILHFIAVSAQSIESFANFKLNAVLSLFNFMISSKNLLFLDRSPSSCLYVC